MASHAFIVPWLPTALSAVLSAVPPPARYIEHEGGHTLSADVMVGARKHLKGAALRRAAAGAGAGAVGAATAAASAHAVPPPPKPLPAAPKLLPTGSEAAPGRAPSAAPAAPPAAAPSPPAKPAKGSKDLDYSKWDNIESDEEAERDLER